MMDYNAGMGHPVLVYLIVILFYHTTATVPPPFKALEFVVEPEDTVAKEGDQIMLPCSAVYGDSVPYVYSWKRNGEVIKPWNIYSSEPATRYVQTNGSLLFTSVTRSGSSPDPALYTCTAEVAYQNTVRAIAAPSIRLSLADLPPMTSQPQDLALYPGETAMFRCHTDGHPEVRYRWTHNGFNLLSSSRLLLHSNGEVLEVRSVNSSDSGQYICRAQNVASHTHSLPATLTIRGRSAGSRRAVGPNFVMRPWDTSADEGSTVMLFCALNGADSDNNQPTVTWLKKGSTINTSSGQKFSIVGSGSLKIVNISLEDAGVYTCRGENLEEMSDAEATLSVKVPPYFRTRPRNTYGRVNEDIILECDIGGTPAPEVVWLKDSDSFPESEYFRFIGHNLKILGLMQTDSGYFQCMGKNAAGSIQAVAQLIVLDADTDVPDENIESFTSSVPSPTQTILPADPSLPPAPSKLEAILISHTYVSLTWTVILRPGASPVTKYTVTTQQVGESRLRTVNTTSTDIYVENLRPNTVYTFTITSFNRNGRSMGTARKQVTTKAEAVVPGVVRNMRARAISHNTISVTWNPPRVANGPISFYKVYYYYSQNQSRELFNQVTNTSLTIYNLHPYTEYHIRVEAINRNGTGPPTEEQPIRTMSAKPSAPPSDVVVEAGSTTVISIRWSPPPASNRNGQITGYKIRYKRKDVLAQSLTDRATAHITDADARSYEIGELTAGVTYLVRIAAVNINGSGDYTPWNEMATYAEELDESRAPGKPSFIQLKAFAREMIVSWGSPEDASDILVRGFRLGYGIGIPEPNWVEDISPSTRIFSLEGLEPKKNYVVQVMAYNNAGNGPNAQQQAFTMEEYELPDIGSDIMPPLEVKVRVISPTSAMITWYDDTLGENQNTMGDRVYTVKYDALSGSEHRKTQYRNTSDLFMRVDGLRPYTKYEFSVMTKKGRRASIFSLAARNTTFEDTPGTAPDDLTVTPLADKPNMLMISWQPPSIPNGRIISYTIYSNTFYNQPLENWIVESVSGQTLNFEFGPVTPATVYFFKIAAHNSKGASPPSPTKALKTLEISWPVNPNRGGDSDRQTREPPAKPATEDKITGVTNPPAQSSGVPSANTLWIIIACVSAITALAIAALVAVLCRRKILNDRKKPANLKASNQAPKGMVKGCKQQPANLWIDHEQVELKGMDKMMDPSDVDERTSMLQSQFDVSASMVGDGYMDEPRYSTLGRQRPIIIAPHQHRDAMPRAAVQPMSADHSRPLYPRTQFTTHNYGSAPRVHVGDTQPVNETSSFCTDPVTGLTGVATPIPDGFTNGELETYNYLTSTPFNKPYMINGEEVPPPRPPPMEGRAYPLRSFNNANGMGHNIPKHIVKPQPISAFKPTAPSPTEQIAVDTGSLKRPPRPPYGNRHNSQTSQNSLSRDNLKMSLKSGSTEHLSSEMAHLDNLMQDLNSIKNGIEYAT